MSKYSPECTRLAQEAVHKLRAASDRTGIPYDVLMRMMVDAFVQQGKRGGAA